MKKTHTALTAAALLLLTACGSAQDEASEETSPQAASTTPTSSPTPSEEPIQEINSTADITDRFTGERVGKATIKTAQNLKCQGKTLKKLVLEITADADSSIAPNYFASGWRAYDAQGNELENIGFTAYSASCTPEEFHQVLINPGETTGNIEVALEITGASFIGLKLAGPVQELRIRID